MVHEKAYRKVGGPSNCISIMFSEACCPKPDFRLRKLPGRSSPTPRSCPLAACGLAPWLCWKLVRSPLITARAK